MSTILVDDIMDLMINYSYSLQFCIAGRTFQFDNDDVPDKILYMEVESIDDPSYQNGTPLCLNLSEDNFDDFDAFEEEFKDYMI